jgi:hypothetical protein
LEGRAGHRGDVEAQSSWLISAWDSLVNARPEFGKLSTPARQQQRKTNIASTAVVIYDLIGAMPTMYAEHIDPDVAFQALAVTDNGEDLFAWDNPSGPAPVSSRPPAPTRDPHHPEQLPRPPGRRPGAPGDHEPQHRLGRLTAGTELPGRPEIIDLGAPRVAPPTPAGLDMAHPRQDRSSECRRAVVLAFASAAL